jgi:hypothetical protein
MWLYPDGSRIMEISTKCLPDEAFQVGVECKDYLAARGVVLGAGQSAKTETTLEFFSARLKTEELNGLAASKGVGGTRVSAHETAT